MLYREFLSQFLDKFAASTQYPFLLCFQIFHIFLPVLITFGQIINFATLLIYLFELKINLKVSPITRHPRELTLRFDFCLEFGDCILKLGNLLIAFFQAHINRIYSCVC